MRSIERETQQVSLCRNRGTGVLPLCHKPARVICRHNSLYIRVPCGLSLKKIFLCVFLHICIVRLLHRTGQRYTGNKRATAFCSESLHQLLNTEIQIPLPQPAGANRSRSTRGLRMRTLMRQLVDHEWRNRSAE